MVRILKHEAVKGLNMLKLILEAAEYALVNADQMDLRNFKLGAIGIRNDGKKVKARNASVKIGEVSAGGLTFPAAHAERKLCGKLDYFSQVFVARISRENGQLRNSRPCKFCMIALRAAKVSKVYYSISNFEYGCIDFTAREFERSFYKK